MVLLHSITALVVYATDLAVVSKQASFALIVFSLCYFLVRDVFRMLPDSWLRILLYQDSATVFTRNGMSYSGKLVRNTVVCPTFIVLRVLPEGARRTVSRVIFPDAVDSGRYRELCVLLKYI